MVESGEQAGNPDFDTQLHEAVNIFSEAVAAETLNPDGLNSAFSGIENILALGIEHRQFTAVRSFQYLVEFSELAVTAADRARNAQLHEQFTSRKQSFETTLRLLGAETKPQETPTPTAKRNMGKRKDR